MAIKQTTPTTINVFNNLNVHYDDGCQICDTVKFLFKS